jgi:hypothetical protein
VNAPCPAARLEDVTAELLGGASRHELTAFKRAVVQHAFRQSLPYADALAALWSGGAWRAAVAREAAPEWAEAQRLTAEEAAGAARAGGPAAGPP